MVCLALRFVCDSNTVNYDQDTTRKRKRDDMDIHGDFESETAPMTGGFEIAAPTTTSTPITNHFETTAAPITSGFKTAPTQISRT